MNFLSTLRALDAAATPGPWMTHFDPYNNPLQHRTLCRIPGQGLPPSGTFFVGHIIGLSPDGPSNADLLVFLRNHAAAIAGVVEAAHTLRKSGDACIASIAKWQATELKDKALAEEYLAAWKVHCEDWKTFSSALTALEDK